jgi:single-stranded DNA-binding protein
MNYQKLIIAGNATKDAQARQSKDGEKTFATFDVGVSDGKDKTTYFPVVVFGKQGEAVAKYVTKGRQVLVEGRVLVNDKGYFNVVADWVQFGPGATAAKEEKPAQ